MAVLGRVLVRLPGGIIPMSETIPHVDGERERFNLVSLDRQVVRCPMPTHRGKGNSIAMASGAAGVLRLQSKLKGDNYSWQRSLLSIRKRVMQSGAAFPSWHGRSR